MELKICKEVCSLEILVQGKSDLDKPTAKDLIASKSCFIWRVF